MPMRIFRIATKAISFALILSLATSNTSFAAVPTDSASQTITENSQAPEENTELEDTKYPVFDAPQNDSSHSDNSSTKPSSSDLSPQTPSEEPSVDNSSSEFDSPDPALSVDNSDYEYKTTPTPHLPDTEFDENTSCDKTIRSLDPLVLNGNHTLVVPVGTSLEELEHMAANSLTQLIDAGSHRIFSIGIPECHTYLPIIWNFSDVDTATPGTYLVPGTFQISEGWSWGIETSPLYANVTVLTPEQATPSLDHYNVVRSKNRQEYLHFPWASIDTSIIKKLTIAKDNEPPIDITNLNPNSTPYAEYNSYGLSIYKLEVGFYVLSLELTNGSTKTTSLIRHTPLHSQARSRFIFQEFSYRPLQNPETPRTHSPAQTAMQTVIPLVTRSVHHTFFNEHPYRNLPNSHYLPKEPLPTTIEASSFYVPQNRTLSNNPSKAATITHQNDKSNTLVTLTIVTLSIGAIVVGLIIVRKAFHINALTKN